MYSRGKKLLEQEQVEAKDKAIAELEAVKKAKQDLDALLKEMGEYQNSLHQGMYFIDSKWIASLTNTLDVVAKGYSVMLENSLNKLESVKGDSEEQFQSAAKALVDSTVSMAADMEEIKIVLNQIYRIFMGNAEKERVALDLLIQELNR